MERDQIDTYTLYLRIDKSTEFGAGNKVGHLVGIGPVDTLWNAYFNQMPVRDPSVYKIVYLIDPVPEPVVYSVYLVDPATVR